MPTTPLSHWAAISFGLVLAAPSASAQGTARTGHYVLTSVGAHNLPIMVSRIVRGEGTTIRAGQLDLQQGGALKGQFVVSYTDSATVTDTILLRGRWTARGDSVFLTYQWSTPRWQGGARVFRVGKPIAGSLSHSWLTFSELAYFDRAFFGIAAPLRFSRGE